MKTIKNPILRGFNPDPSIIRVGADYYIATSTFEWFPGVQIHHSRDLVHWELIARPLNRRSQLNMLGNPDSCGVWAPCLSYKDGVFYLVYSNVRSFDGVWKDTPNYLVTTTDIRGDWSEPIFLSASGFDGSLFHDDDGRKWFTSMVVDQRGGTFFGGIILQELDLIKKRLVGPVYHIFKGTELGKTEAPHLYKRNGYYYLLTAEGGTEYGHAVTLARSKKLRGPYQLHPQNPIISTRDQPQAPLQKCGHSDLVETPNGGWFAVFLVGRPLSELGPCTLGRETAIEEVEWRSDGWLYLKNSTLPRLEIPLSDLEDEILVEQSKEYLDFEDQQLPLAFQSLRLPISEEWLSLTVRKSYLRLYGKESLNSLHHQSLVARRIQHFHIQATSCLEFFPLHYQQMAGLVCYYNTGHWFYLHLLGGEMEEPSGKKFLQITSCDNFEVKEHLEEVIDLSAYEQVHLRAKFDHADLQFWYSTNGQNWIPIGPKLDGSILSDDYVRDGSSRYRPAFTGAFVGICCQDLSGQKQSADFEYFHYEEM